MGMGDEIMAAGQAQRLYDDDPSYLVAISNRRGEPRWHDLWAGNPAIATPRQLAAGVPSRVLKNAVGCRPYIRYPFTAIHGIRFTEWRARDHVGRLYLTDDELAVGHRLREQIGPFVMMEPDVKTLSTPNKAWGVGRFQQVADALPQITFVRAHGEELGPVKGLQNVRTRTFRDACGILAASDGYVGTEGGVHHAAAALGKPAVVIFGGFISPLTTGYPSHINIADTDTGSPCGRWMPCQHCREAMNRITVDHVAEAVESLFATLLERAS